jgi:hypothetical protein
VLHDEHWMVALLLVYDPAGQDLHCVWPEVSWKNPAVQEMHLSCMA